jgi:hypothetical protein
MALDMAGKGWAPADVAVHCKPRAARSSVTRFLSGENQSPAMAKRIATALGFSVKRYLIADREEAIA